MSDAPSPTFDVPENESLFQQGLGRGRPMYLVTTEREEGDV